MSMQCVIKNVRDPIMENCEPQHHRFLEAIGQVVALPKNRVLCEVTTPTNYVLRRLMPSALDLIGLEFSKFSWLFFGFSVPSIGDRQLVSLAAIMETDLVSSGV